MPTETTVEKYKDDLTANLLETCTGSGLLKGLLLETPDIEEAWMRLAPSFYGDAVRNFNAYPEYCLACAGYLGMAIAYLWDKDWAGFDDMDDYITDNILKDRKHSVPAMQTCSANAYHFLMRECMEPGTAEAYQFFLVTVEVMFKIGAAIELGRLGYKYEKMDLGN